jgi:hypothetical protein
MPQLYHSVHTNAAITPQRAHQRRNYPTACTPTPQISHSVHANAAVIPQRARQRRNYPTACTQTPQLPHSVHATAAVIPQRTHQRLNYRTACTPTPQLSHFNYPSIGCLLSNKTWESQQNQIIPEPLFYLTTIVKWFLCYAVLDNDKGWSSNS